VVPLNQEIHGSPNNSKFFTRDARERLNQNSKKIVRNHIARIDLSAFFAGSKAQNFALRLDLKDLNGWKGDYVFEGISVVNVSPDC